jgi:hypothetical protein
MGGQSKRQKSTKIYVMWHRATLSPTDCPHPHFPNTMSDTKEQAEQDEQAFDAECENCHENELCQYVNVKNCGGLYRMCKPCLDVAREQNQVRCHFGIVPPEALCYEPVSCDSLFCKEHETKCESCHEDSQRHSVNTEDRGMLQLCKGCTIDADTAGQIMCQTCNVSVGLSLNNFCAAHDPNLQVRPCSLSLCMYLCVCACLLACYWTCLLAIGCTVCETCC